MVVQSIALPKVSGSPREPELAAVSVETAAAPPAPAVAGRSFYAPVLVPVLVATQGAWLALLGYAAFRVLG